MDTMTGTQALTKFFNTDGYPKLTMAELTALKKTDPKGYDHLCDLACQALGVERATS